MEAVIPMENTIGEKIKLLRKELKMTQAALAGNEMTKSMLSQIENNQATPSMKSLQYIAQRLGKSPSYFLDNEKENIPVDDINKKLNKIDKLIKNFEYVSAREKIEKILSAYSYDKDNKLYADILYKYGECLQDMLEFDSGEKKIKEAVKIYTGLHLTTYAARANMELIRRYYNEYNYDECLKILDESWNMYKHAVNHDSLLEIEMLFYRSLVKLADASAEEVLELIQKALDISNENGAYYKSDELYRLKALVYFVMEKYNDFLFCIKKAKQFAQFSDNYKSLSKIEISLAMYENALNNPENAIEHLKKFDKFNEKRDFGYYANLSLSYYLLKNYKEAYANILKINYKPQMYHKIDYFLLWTGKVYEGLILNKLDKTEKALDSINFAINKLEFFDDSKYLAFAYKSLSDIYAEKGDYEKAYAAIKKAYDIRNILVKEGKIAY